LNAEGHPEKILRKDLTTLARVWSVLSYSNLAPTSHTSDLTVDRDRLIFGLVSQMDMNVGALISSQITSMAQSNSSRLRFPALITALCKSRRVASDSLVFKHLSLVINLAYIRKNYWNPDEGPTAQVPQQMKNESSKTTTPKPLVRRKKADETQEAVATSKKSLEATSKPSEPVADTTSPQQAADPSTAEDHTTPVLSPNTSPTATLVLHLTDEEDV